MSDLRAQLEGSTTEELLALLRRHDEGEWRPEVFDLAAEIVQARGVPLPRPIPTEPLRAQASALPATPLAGWEAAVVALLLVFISTFVEIPVAYFVAFSAFSLSVGLLLWWVVVFVVAAALRPRSLSVPKTAGLTAALVVVQGSVLYATSSMPLSIAAGTAAALSCTLVLVRVPTSGVEGE